MACSDDTAASHIEIIAAGRTRTVILCYSETVKNITVSVPADVYRRARVVAAEAGTSVSALVADYLRDLARDDSTFDRLVAQERRIRSEIRSFRASDRLTRDQVHDRAVR